MGGLLGGVAILLGLVLNLSGLMVTEVPYLGRFRRVLGLSLMAISLFWLTMGSFVLVQIWPRPILVIGRLLGLLGFFVFVLLALESFVKVRNEAQIMKDATSSTNEVAAALDGAPVFGDINVTTALAGASNKAPSPQDNKYPDLIDVYKIAIQARNFEINLFWRRSWFFWGFTLALGTGYVAATDNTLRMALAHVGLVASTCWFLINKAGKYWQESIEQKLLKLEDLLPARGVTLELFTRAEPLKQKGLLGGARLSPSKLTIGFSMVLVAGFFALSFFEVMKAVNKEGTEKFLAANYPLMVSSATLAVIVFLIWRGRPSKNP